MTGAAMSYNELLAIAFKARWCIRQLNVPWPHWVIEDRTEMYPVESFPSGEDAIAAFAAGHRNLGDQLGNLALMLMEEWESPGCPRYPRELSPFPPHPPLAGPWTDEKRSAAGHPAEGLTQWQIPEDWRPIGTKRPGEPVALYAVPAPPADTCSLCDGDSLECECL